MTTITVTASRKYSIELSLLMTNNDIFIYRHKTTLEGNDKETSWTIGPHPNLLKIYITDIYVYTDEKSYKYKFKVQNYGTKINIIIDKHGARINDVPAERTIVTNNSMLWCCSPKYVLDYVMD